MPEARLSIYSAVLTKGLKGEDIPTSIMPILKQVQAAASANVVVIEPRSDDGMAEAYRASRVHLYPGDAQDFACWTLGESQAVGLPAVGRNLGGVSERIDTGQTGYVVPDADALANVTLEILRNDAVYKTLNATASEVTRRRPWASAAEELDAFVATLPAPVA
jgi:glycosyltransferase involved in cell wall biosynthesis